MSIELATEHEPSMWISGLLGVIADQLSDSRRGLLADGGEVITVVHATDNGFDVVLSLTITYQ